MKVAEIGLLPMVVVWVLHAPVDILSREAELQTDALEALRSCRRLLQLDAMTPLRFRFWAVRGAPPPFRALGGTKKWRYFCW